MAETLLTEGYNGGTLSANVGDTFTVKLPENPTTGYRWVIDTGQTEIFVQTGDGYQSGEPAIGSGGFRILRFTAKSRGNVQLSCKLIRSWDRGRPKTTFGVHITVI